VEFLSKKKTFTKTVFKLVTTSILVVFLGGCGLLPKEEALLAPPLIQAPKVTYEEVAVTKGTIEKKITGQGSLVSVSQENLFFKFKGGTLKSINVTLGQTIKKGTVVAELDTDDLESRIKQQDLSDRQAQLTLEDANDQLAEDIKKEAEGKNSSSPDLENLTDQVRKSTSQVKRAEFDIEKNNLAMQSLQLEKQKSIVTSTLDGEVIFVDTINAGDYASAFKTLVTIADPSNLQLQYTGDNMDAFDIGKKVSLKYNDKDYVGTVVMNPGSMPIGTNKDAKKYVQIKVDNLPKDVELGGSMDISITTAKKDNIIVVSKNLIHTTEGRSYVEMLDKGLKVERNVELGLQTPTEAEIIKGLNEGEKIIK
jgi:RND family efflux transporter MFP subunit